MLAVQTQYKDLHYIIGGDFVLFFSLIKRKDQPGQKHDPEVNKRYQCVCHLKQCKTVIQSSLHNKQIFFS